VTAQTIEKKLINPDITDCVEPDEPEDDYDDFDIVAALRAKGAVFHDGHALPASWYDPEEDAVWEEQLRIVIERDES